MNTENFQNPHHSLYTETFRNIRLEYNGRNGIVHLPDDIIPYAGRFLDVRLEYDGRNGIMHLPDDISLVCRKRHKSFNDLMKKSSQLQKKLSLEATVAYMHDNLPCVKVFDVLSPEFSSGNESDPFYHKICAEDNKDRIRMMIPHLLLLHGKLEPSRVFVAASEDGNSFTLWRNELWFQKAGSSCIASEDCTEMYRAVKKDSVGDYLTHKFVL